ncbi:hypothetical protein ABZ214_40095 [Streptomyces iakyrus]|uniref:hypothetical protein n=1 Tax=Streptomyces iakyrus TaxID=68219 RepID=UPI0033A17074
MTDDVQRCHILRIEPGESVEAFTSRVADSAPALTPELADQLRALLVPLSEQVGAVRAAEEREA